MVRFVTKVNPNNSAATTCFLETCPLPDIPFGSVLPEIEPVLHGVTASISCEPNFELEGSRLVACQSADNINTNWEDGLPVCKRR